MTRLLVDIELKILIVVNKTPSFFVNSKMRIVLLRQKIYVVPVGDLRLYFYHLTTWLILSPYSVYVTVMPCNPNNDTFLLW
jgi:hypothetical protein